MKKKFNKQHHSITVDGYTIEKVHYKTTDGVECYFDLVSKKEENICSLVVLNECGVDDGVAFTITKEPVHQLYYITFDDYGVALSPIGSLKTQRAQLVMDALARRLPLRAIWWFECGLAYFTHQYTF